MEILVAEAKERIKAVTEGAAKGRRALAPLLSDPYEEVSNNAFVAFLDALAD